MESNIAEVYNVVSDSHPADSSDHTPGSDELRIAEKTALKKTELVTHLIDLGWTEEDAEAESDLWKMSAVIRPSGTWLGAVDMTYRYHGKSTLFVIYLFYDLLNFDSPCRWEVIVLARYSETIFRWSERGVPTSAQCAFIVEVFKQ
jgi:hypothetical protein